MQGRISPSAGGIFLGAGLAIALLGGSLLSAEAWSANEIIDQANDVFWSGGSTNIAPASKAGQGIVPSCNNISSVEIALTTLNSGRGDDVVTTRVLRDGSQIASTQRDLPQDFDGWVKFEFNPVIEVTRGEDLILQVEDTGKIVFGWKLSSDTYPNGTSLFFGNVNAAQDRLFRTSATSCPAFVRFKETDVEISEGDVSLLELVIDRTHQLDATLSVDVRTEGDTATEGEDYLGGASRLVFDPMERETQYFVTIIDDDECEGVESFTAHLKYAHGEHEATVTILPSDCAEIGFNKPVASFFEQLSYGGGDRWLTISVVRTGDPSSSISVEYRTRDGSAIASQDYTFSSGILRFAPYELEKEINIRIINDECLEGTENHRKEEFYIDLINPTADKGTVATTQSSITVEILELELCNFVLGCFYVDRKICKTESGGGVVGAALLIPLLLRPILNRRRTRIFARLLRLGT